MKKLTVLFVVAAVAIAIVGCDDSNPADASGQTWITYAFAFHGELFPLRQDVTDLWGQIVSDPIAAPGSITMNGTEFSGQEYWDNIEGILSFGYCTIFDDFDPLTVEITTSLGSTGCTVPLPEMPTAFAYSDPESLDIGEDLTVFWSGGDADFYYVEIDYEHEFGTDYKDTLVTGTSWTVDGSFFPFNGEIWGVYLQAINGPVPEPGSGGNMSGDGTGFLFHILDGDWDLAGIVVGNGLPLKADRRPTPGTDARREKVGRAILKANGLSGD